MSESWGHQPGKMPGEITDAERGVDVLIMSTSRLNSRLVQYGLPTLSLPERHLPITNFFNDLMVLLDALYAEVETADE